MHADNRDTNLSLDLFFVFPSLSDKFSPLHHETINVSPARESGARTPQRSSAVESQKRKRQSLQIFRPTNLRNYVQSKRTDTTGPKKVHVLSCS